MLNNFHVSFWDGTSHCRPTDHLDQYHQYHQSPLDCSESGATDGAHHTDQWPFQEPKSEVSTIYKAYVRAM